jgi:hypothetical protein
MEEALMKGAIAKVVFTTMASIALPLSAGCQTTDAKHKVETAASSNDRIVE